MEQVSTGRVASLGFIGFILGVVSVLVILIQISTIMEPDDTRSAGQVIGEIAADIRQSAQRALSGEPEPQRAPPPPDYSLAITVAALGAAALAVVLGGVAILRHEPPRLASMAIGLGMTAFVMQYVFWLAIIICGVFLLVSIIGNLGAILGE